MEYWNIKVKKLDEIKVLGFKKKQLLNLKKGNNYKSNITKEASEIEKDILTFLYLTFFSDFRKKSGPTFTSLDVKVLKKELKMNWGNEMCSVSLAVFHYAVGGQNVRLVTLFYFITFLCSVFFENGSRNYNSVYSVFWTLTAKIPLSKVCVLFKTIQSKKTSKTKLHYAPKSSWISHPQPNSKTIQLITFISLHVQFRHCVNEGHC